MVKVRVTHTVSTSLPAVSNKYPSPRICRVIKGECQCDEGQRGEGKKDEEGAGRRRTRRGSRRWCCWWWWKKRKSVRVWKGKRGDERGALVAKESTKEMKKEKEY